MNFKHCIFLDWKTQNFINSHKQQPKSKNFDQAGGQKTNQAAFDFLFDECVNTLHSINIWNIGKEKFLFFSFSFFNSTKDNRTQ